MKILYEELVVEVDDFVMEWLEYYSEKLHLTPEELASYALAAFIRDKDDISKKELRDMLDY